MALLEDQIEETQAALIAADQAGDAEAARHLADHLRGLEEQHAAVLKAQQESSQSEGSYRNPMITAGVGATAGAIANPLRNEVSALIAKPAPVPEMKMPHPSQIMPGATHGGQDWTKALTGVDVPGAQMNKQSLDTAQRMASTVARGGELAGGSITPGGILLGPELGAKPPAPAPMIPRNVAQAKEKGMNLLQSVVGEHQPSRPFDIVKGGAKGSIAGAALGDVPQQVMQGNVGTAAADVGLGGGTIAHGLARTPKGKALAGLIALGSGATRVGQGINELTAPVEQKAGGGLIGNMASQAAINAPFMLPEMANIGKNVTRGAYAPAMENAASLGLALAPINPLTAGLSLMAPGEAGRGSTVDEWNARKAAEEAARQRAIKKLQYEQFMQQQVGANAPQLLENYLVQQAAGKAEGGIVGYAPGGKIVKSALDALTKASEGKLGQVADKNLVTLQDYHTSLNDRVMEGVKAMQDKIANTQYKYNVGDRVFTDWTVKNNYPPMEILAKRMYGGERSMALRDPATGKPLLDAAGNKIREPERAGYMVKHEFTHPEHGEVSHTYVLPEDKFKGMIEPEEPYKKGGDVKKPEGYAPGGRVGALTELLNLVRNRGGSEAAKRLERAADLVPNLEHQYQPEALKGAFTGDNARAVMVMNPKDFEKYAAPIDADYKKSVMKSYGIGNAENFEGYDAMPKGTYQDYIDYLGQYAKPQGGGFSSVPYLQLGKELHSSFPVILGHEGRHRTAALEKLGDQSTLVQMMPRAALREPFPRRSQEEYLEALINEIGQKPFVKPQVYMDDAGKDVRRGLIELPELFKKGGLV